MNTRRELGHHAKHWERHLVVVPRSMHPALCRYLIEVARRLPAAVVCHRYLVVVPRPLPAAPFLVHRMYLIVVPRPLPAAPLAVHRTNFNVVPRPVPRPLPAATRRCRSRRRSFGRGDWVISIERAPTHPPPPHWGFALAALA